MRPSLRAYLLLTLISITLTQACATAERQPASTTDMPVVRTRDSIPRPELRLADTLPRPPRLTTIATYKVNRQVSVFYKLDLAKDNRYAQAMATLLRQQEDKIRACYMQRLDATPQLKGQIAFSFVVSKTGGSMDRIKRIGGSLDDPRLNACLSRELAKVPLNPPRDMRGKLLYQFNVVESVAKN
jgi:hypothetical protein